MRHHLILLVAFSVTVPAFAQTPPANGDQAATITFARDAAVRALEFHQGDLASLTDARADFTAEGWNAFLKHMHGWLDSTGAPTFSSSFVPTRDARLVWEESGVLHIRIPGTLKQTQSTSTTTYGHSAIEVQVAGKPPKVRHLEQITCGSDAAPCQ